MKKLHMIDDTFLRLENRRQPLHIGTLLLFEPPKRAGKDFVAQIAPKLRSSEKAKGVYNQRLVEQKGKHYWEENDDFDVEHHFVHLALPATGRVRELLDMVSRLHCGHLERAYPLWRIYLIEGLEDGRVALYLKIHHSMVDGVSGMKMIMESMSTSARESRNLPPLWEVERKRKKGGQVPVVPTPAASGMLAMRAAARADSPPSPTPIRVSRRSQRPSRQRATIWCWPWFPVLCASTCWNWASFPTAR